MSRALVSAVALVVEAAAEPGEVVVAVEVVGEEAVPVGAEAAVPLAVVVTLLHEDEEVAEADGDLPRHDHPTPMTMVGALNSILFPSTHVEIPSGPPPPPRPRGRPPASSSASASASASTSNAAASSSNAVNCSCGVAAVRRTVTSNSASKGRAFWGCGSDVGCGFFEFVDGPGAVAGPSRPAPAPPKTVPAKRPVSSRVSPDLSLMQSLF